MSKEEELGYPWLVEERGCPGRQGSSLRPCAPAEIGVGSCLADRLIVTNRAEGWEQARPRTIDRRLWGHWEGLRLIQARRARVAWGQLCPEE